MAALGGILSTTSVALASDTVVVVKGADESVVSSTTLQDDDALLFAVGGNELWVVQFEVYWEAETAGDIVFRVTGPTGSTILAGRMGRDTTDDADPALVFTDVRDGVTGLLGSGGTGAGNKLYTHIGAICRNGATAGNCTLQWAQLASSATATKVLANSYLIARKS